MRLFLVIILGLLGFIAITAFSPQAKTKVRHKLSTFFACKQAGKIVMSAAQFTSFMDQGLCAKDSLDSIYKVIRFDMIYAETGLYQDPEGLPIVHTDYSYGTFKGNTLSMNWQKKLKQHAYRGDTIRFNNILARGTDSLTYRCSDIELILR